MAEVVQPRHGTIWLERAFTGILHTFPFSSSSAMAAEEKAHSAAISKFTPAAREADAKISQVTPTLIVQGS